MSVGLFFSVLEGKIPAKRRTKKPLSFGNCDLYFREVSVTCRFEGFHVHILI